MTTPTATPPDAIQRRRPPRSELPSWYPPWALSLADLYFSGSSSVFALYGNTFDLVPLCDPAEEEKGRYGGIAEFLAEQLFVAGSRAALRFGSRAARLCGSERKAAA